MNEFMPSRALVIVAHPDDIEYFCGGTIAKWINNGCSVSFVVTSSGNKGSNDPNKDIEDLVRTRESEQRASAQLLGVSNVVFLRYPDAELSFVDSNDLRAKYVRYVRQAQAEIVLTHDPDVRFVKQHPDHRAVGRMVIDASYPIAGVSQCYREQIIEEGLRVCQPEYVLLFGTDSPNHWIDISSTLDLKIKSLQEHHSQVGAFPGGVDQRCRWRAQEAGQRGGLVAAEEFLCVRTGSTLPTS